MKNRHSVSDKKSYSRQMINFKFKGNDEEASNKMEKPRKFDMINEKEEENEQKPVENHKRGTKHSFLVRGSGTAGGIGATKQEIKLDSSRREPG